MHEGGDGEIPGGVGGHAEAEEGPNAVVVEGRYEHGGGAAGSEDIRPCALVKSIIYVVDVAVSSPTPLGTAKKLIRNGDSEVE